VTGPLDLASVLFSEQFERIIRYIFILEEMRLKAAMHLAFEIDQNLSLNIMKIRLTNNMKVELKVYLLLPDN
jgi:hypothetical protein